MACLLKISNLFGSQIVLLEVTSSNKMMFSPDKRPQSTTTIHTYHPDCLEGRAPPSPRRHATIHNTWYNVPRADPPITQTRESNNLGGGGGGWGQNWRVEFRVLECYLPQTRLWGHRETIVHVGTTCVAANSALHCACNVTSPSFVHSCEYPLQPIAVGAQGQDREDRGVPPSVGSVLCHSLGQVGGGQQLFAIPQGTWVAAYPSHTTRRAHDDRVMACVSRLTAYRWHTHKARWSLHTRRTPRVASPKSGVGRRGARSFRGDRRRPRSPGWSEGSAKEVTQVVGRSAKFAR